MTKSIETKLNATFFFAIYKLLIGGHQKRRIGMSERGFHGDTFSDGFGGFQTMRKRQWDPELGAVYQDLFPYGFGVNKVNTGFLERALAL